MKRAFVHFGFLCTTMFVSNIAMAQVFGGETSAQTSSSAFQAEKTVSPNASNTVSKPVQTSKKAAPAIQPAPAEQPLPLEQPKQMTSAADDEDEYEEAEAEAEVQASPDEAEASAMLPPTEETVLPSNVQTRTVAGPGHVGIEREGEDNGAIFLYYKDFSIDRSIEDMIACSLRFVLYTTFEKKLSNISLRLTWPGLSTKLSFSDVEPNNEYHKDYTFFGDGCYSMDKLPNVTINRCRLKGKSQQQCAGLFHLSKE